MCCRALLVTWAFKQYSHECRKVQSNWEIRTACCMQVINLYPGKLCSWEKLYRVTVGKQLNIHPRVAERSKELRLVRYGEILRGNSLDSAHLQSWFRSILFLLVLMAAC